MPTPPALPWVGAFWRISDNQNDLSPGGSKPLQGLFLLGGVFELLDSASAGRDPSSSNLAALR